MPRTSLPSDVESLKKLLHAAQEQLQVLRAAAFARCVDREDEARTRVFEAHEVRPLSDNSMRRLRSWSSPSRSSKPTSRDARIASECNSERTRAPRKPLPSHLPRRVVVHEPWAASANAPSVAQAPSLSEDSSEVLEYVPALEGIQALRANTPAQMQRSSRPPRLAPHQRSSRAQGSLPISPCPSTASFASLPAEPDLCPRWHRASSGRPWPSGSAPLKA